MNGSRLNELLGRVLRLVQQSPRLHGHQERPHEGSAVRIGGGVGQRLTEHVDVLACLVEGCAREEQIVGRHVRIVDAQSATEQPKELDTNDTKRPVSRSRVLLGRDAVRDLAQPVESHQPADGDRGVPLADRQHPEQVDLGRWPFWLALVVALYVWALTTDFAPVQSILAVFGALLGAAVQLSEDQRHAIEQRIRQSLADAGYTIKSAAICIYGKPERAPDLEKALHGERPVNLPLWEIKLGAEFARIYAVRTLLELGPPTFARKAMKMWDAINQTEGVA
jgi:hypothetical protein